MRFLPVFLFVVMILLDTQTVRAQDGIMPVTLDYNQSGSIYEEAYRILVNTEGSAVNNYNKKWFGRPILGYRFIPLNDDNAPELVVSVISWQTCVPQGCPYYIISPQRSGYKIVGEFIASKKRGLYIDRNVTHNYNDIHVIYKKTRSSNGVALYRFSPQNNKYSLVKEG